MTIITDDNIHELVDRYFSNDDELPADLIDVQIGHWDVSRVTNMDFLFMERHFDEPIGGWDVSNVESMESMFQDTFPFNQPIGGWDVSNVKNMSSMFAGGQGSFNQPIGDWDVSSVTDMSSMFAETTFNQPIGDWDVSSVTDMSYMFAETTFNQPIGGWDVSNVTDMGGMFAYTQAFNQPIGSWNTAKVTNMSYMFARTEAFNQPIGGWDVSNVTDMSKMFYRAHAFNQVRPTPAAARAPPPAPAVPAPAVPAPAVPAVLQNNIDYKPALLPTPHFSVSKEKVFRYSEYFDFIDGVDKLVLNALDEDPTAIVFNVHKRFYVISASDLTNLMNNPDFIKYECLSVDSMANIERSVPYLSINSIGIQSQGAVPYFHLWTAVHSGNRTYELVKTAHRLPSTASHNILYNWGSRISAAHCQTGQDVDVYELRILPVDREHSAATKIQKLIRRHISRKKSKNPTSGGKKRSNRRKHARHNKRTRKGSRMHKKMH